MNGGPPGHPAEPAARVYRGDGSEALHYASITVKIHDGNWRPLGAICVEVLKQLDIIGKIEHFDYMKKHEQPYVRNAQKIVTERIVPSFRLRKA